MMLVVRLRCLFPGKDAGSARIQCDTGATEDGLETSIGLAAQPVIPSSPPEADVGPEWRHALKHSHSGLPLAGAGARTSSRRASPWCAFVSVATTVGIVAALFVPAIEFFREISIVDFLTGTNWAPLFEPPASACSR